VRRIYRRGTRTSSSSLTRFAGAGYPRCDAGDRAIPDLAQQPDRAASETESAHDLERLQRAIEGLVERYKALRAENESLRARLVERDERLRELNQRRQDALKRIDDLVVQIDALDGRLESSS
jgi:chromosome segregation ATPase